MKKILVVFILFGILNVANAKGVKIFDLKEQYFSQTMLKKGQDGYHKEAKYDLPKVIVTTDTIFDGHGYKDGLFTVDLKEPLSNWNVSIKKKNGAIYSGTMTGIRLVSDSGNIYFISFNSNKSEYGNDDSITKK